MREFVFQKHYKDIMRIRCRELKQSDRQFSLKHIADALRIQYTYFSKVLNQDHLNFNEDQLFKICRILELPEFLTDYMIWNRTWHAAQDKSLKAYALNKMKRIRETQKVRAPSSASDQERFTEQSGLLLDPVCFLVHVALYIDRFRIEPERLRGELNLSAGRFAEILDRLEHSGYISRDPKTNTILEHHHEQLHFPQSHPMMKAHQQIFKQLAQTHAHYQDQNSQENFVVTFTGDQKSFERIKQEFFRFLEQAKTISDEAKEEYVYYMQFDLIKWF